MMNNKHKLNYNDVSSELLSILYKETRVRYKLKFNKSERRKHSSSQILGRRKNNRNRNKRNFHFLTSIYRIKLK